VSIVFSFVSDRVPATGVVATMTSRQTKKATRVIKQQRTTLSNPPCDLIPIFREKKDGDEDLKNVKNIFKNIKQQLIRYVLEIDESSSSAEEKYGELLKLLSDCSQDVWEDKAKTASAAASSQYVFNLLNILTIAQRYSFVETGSGLTLSEKERALIERVCIFDYDYIFLHPERSPVEKASVLWSDANRKQDITQSLAWLRTEIAKTQEDRITKLLDTILENYDEEVIRKFLKEYKDEHEISAPKYRIFISKRDTAAERIMKKMAEEILTTLQDLYHPNTRKLIPLLLEPFNGQLRTRKKLSKRKKDEPQQVEESKAIFEQILHYMRQLRTSLSHLLIHRPVETVSRAMWSILTSILSLIRHLLYSLGVVTNFANWWWFYEKNVLSASSFILLIGHYLIPYLVRYYFGHEEWAEYIAYSSWESAAWIFSFSFTLMGLKVAGNSIDELFANKVPGYRATTTGIKWYMTTKNATTYDAATHAFVYVGNSTKNFYNTQLQPALGHAYNKTLNKTAEYVVKGHLRILENVYQPVCADEIMSEYESIFDYQARLQKEQKFNWVHFGTLHSCWVDPEQYIKTLSHYADRSPAEIDRLYNFLKYGLRRKFIYLSGREVYNMMLNAPPPSDFCPTPLRNQLPLPYNVSPEPGNVQSPNPYYFTWNPSLSGHEEDDDDDEVERNVSPEPGNVQSPNPYYFTWDPSISGDDDNNDEVERGHSNKLVSVSLSNRERWWQDFIKLGKLKEEAINKEKSHTGVVPLSQNVKNMPDEGQRYLVSLWFGSLSTVSQFLIADRGTMEINKTILFLGAAGLGIIVYFVWQKVCRKRTPVKRSPLEQRALYLDMIRGHGDTSGESDSEYGEVVQDDMSGESDSEYGDDMSGESDSEYGEVVQDYASGESDSDSEEMAGGKINRTVVDSSSWPSLATTDTAFREKSPTFRKREEEEEEEEEEGIETVPKDVLSLSNKITDKSDDSEDGSRISMPTSFSDFPPTSSLLWIPGWEEIYRMLWQEESSIVLRYHKRKNGPSLLDGCPLYTSMFEGSRLLQAAQMYVTPIVHYPRAVPIFGKSLPGVDLKRAALTMTEYGSGLEQKTATLSVLDVLLRLPVWVEYSRIFGENRSKKESSYESSNVLQEFVQLFTHMQTEQHMIQVSNDNPIVSVPVAYSSVSHTKERQYEGKGDQTQNWAAPLSEKPTSLIYNMHDFANTPTDVWESFIGKVLTLFSDKKQKEAFERLTPFTFVFQSTSTSHNPVLPTAKETIRIEVDPLEVDKDASSPDAWEMFASSFPFWSSFSAPILASPSEEFKGLDPSDVPIGDLGKALITYLEKNEENYILRAPPVLAVQPRGISTRFGYTTAPTDFQASIFTSSSSTEGEQVTVHYRQKAWVARFTNTEFNSPEYVTGIRNDTGDVEYIIYSQKRSAYEGRTIGQNYPNDSGITIFGAPLNYYLVFYERCYDDLKERTEKAKEEEDIRVEKEQSRGFFHSKS
jgi:hypothetical protein